MQIFNFRINFYCENIILLSEKSGSPIPKQIFKISGNHINFLYLSQKWISILFPSGESCIIAASGEKRLYLEWGLAIAWFPPLLKVQLDFYSDRTNIKGVETLDFPFGICNLRCKRWSRPRIWYCYRTSRGSSFSWIKLWSSFQPITRDCPGHLPSNDFTGLNYSGFLPPPRYMDGFNLECFCYHLKLLPTHDHKTAEGRPRFANRIKSQPLFKPHTPNLDYL